MIRRIAITGPESTGKSQLSEELAKYYHTHWVPEFARDYLQNLGRPYEQIDILNIAQGQLLRENEIAKQANGFLFCDTEFIVTKIWSEVKYHSCDPWILEKVKSHRYDLYLLCEPDIPWEPDPLREHPELRQDLFIKYQNALITGEFPFVIINGLGKSRMQHAIHWINARLK